ncbi:MAG: hypothetical protein MUD12_15575 [Spirochaetes bacterium]|jgi:hypothetical protein|nr:hypothetical protein [Spirochaetota bacterium]
MHAIDKIKTNEDLKISLSLLISFFFHVVVFIAIIIPNIQYVLDPERLSFGKENRISGRDIIVNINQDDKRVINDKTLLSDRDSSAKGFLTKEKGDRWLNNSRDFQLLTGGRMAGQSGGIPVSGSKEKILLGDNSEVAIMFSKSSRMTGSTGSGGFHDRVLIPDKKGVTKYNAIFYSNTGMFSFNTARFKNFLYFKKMKDKIASNWYPPIMANAAYSSYNPVSGGYAPGRTRIMAIPSQEVKLYFIMNRNGDVVEVKILDSLGNTPLDASCLDSIRLSRSFGKIPEDIKGEFVLIPFIFGYYVD